MIGPPAAEYFVNGSFQYRERRVRCTWHVNAYSRTLVDGDYAMVLGGGGGTQGVPEAGLVKERIRRNIMEKVREIGLTFLTRRTTLGLTIYSLEFRPGALSPRRDRRRPDVTFSVPFRIPVVRSVSYEYSLRPPAGNGISAPTIPPNRVRTHLMH